MLRSVRWLDRCIAFHKASGRDKPSQDAGDEPALPEQNLFAIIQGGLDPALRTECLEEMVKRKEDVPGYAIGGLSGGEEKGWSLQFCYFCMYQLFCRHFLENVRLLCALEIYG